MTHKSGRIYPSNRKKTWVVITQGEKKAFIASGSNRDAAARKFLAARNMRMVRARKK
jgi:hypothetical protein